MRHHTTQLIHCFIKSMSISATMLKWMGESRSPCLSPFFVWKKGPTSSFMCRRRCGGLSDLGGPIRVYRPINNRRVPNRLSRSWHDTISMIFLFEHLFLQFFIKIILFWKKSGAIAGWLLFFSILVSFKLLGMFRSSPFKIVWNISKYLKHF